MGTLLWDLVFAFAPLALTLEVRGTPVAARLSPMGKTRGFASPPRGGFAFGTGALALLIAPFIGAGRGTL
jgi:hypothetical protein